MRIATLTIESRAINGITGQQNKLSKTEQQLATGKRIVVPSDDPADATRVLDLSKSEARDKQYQDNINMAESRLSFEESSLGHAIDVLQRIRELAVQGVNGTQGSQNRASIAGEIRQRLDELMSLANTKDANGEYLFAGHQSHTKPFNGDPFLQTGATFSYVGDQGSRSTQISPTRSVATADPGNEVFMSVPDPVSGQSRDIFSMVYDFAVSMEANTPSNQVLSQIDEAMGKIMDTQAKVGARRNVLDSQTGINDDHILGTQMARSNLEDLDYAEAISRMNLQVTGLQAAQQAYSKVQGLSLFNYL